MRHRSRSRRGSPVHSRESGYRPIPPMEIGGEPQEPVAKTNGKTGMTSVFEVEAALDALFANHDEELGTLMDAHRPPAVGAEAVPGELDPAVLQMASASVQGALAGLQAEVAAGEDQTPALTE